MGAAETVTALQPHLHQNLESDPNEAVGQRVAPHDFRQVLVLIELGSLEYGMVTNSRMPSSYFSSLDWKNTPLRKRSASRGYHRTAPSLDPTAADASTG